MDVVTNEMMQISPRARSSITNGRRVHKRGTVDGRSHAARRWRDLYLAFIDELGHAPTPVEDAQLRQCASLALKSEDLSTAMAAGAHVDSHELRSLSAELRRQLRDLGIAAARTASEPEDLDDLMVAG